MANTLIVRYTRIGDALIVLPLIYGLANAHKEDTFTVISNERFEPLFDHMPENIVYIPIVTKNSKGIFRGISYIIRRKLFLLKIKKKIKGFDKIAFLQNNSFDRKIYNYVLSKTDIPVAINTEEVDDLGSENHLLNKC